MDFEEFKQRSQEGENPPVWLSDALCGLWLDAAGNWEESHNLVQETGGKQAAWVHAYLHRKEGDLSNARYWYRRAAKSEFTGPLEEEWEQIVRTLLGSA